MDEQTLLQLHKFKYILFIRSYGIALKKVLVTGATGRIGSNLIKELLRRGYEVRSFAVSTDPYLYKLKSMETEIVYGDIRDYNNLLDAADDVDVVVHLAALFAQFRAGVSKQELINANVVGTLNALEASVNRSVDKFIFSSTDATYPISNPLYWPVDENHPQRPNNIYGLTKVLSEKTCFEYSTEYGLPTTVLRYGSVLAPPEIINTLKGGKEKFSIRVDKNGTPFKMHLSDVRDVVEGTILAIAKKASENEVFNILGCAVFTLDEAVKYAAEHAGQDYITIKDHKAVATPSFEADLTKARNILGYRPKYDVFRMIDDSLKYLNGEDVGVIPTGYAQ
jgi:UDP-glucose 4-epimerase